MGVEGGEYGVDCCCICSDARVHWDMISDLGDECFNFFFSRKNLSTIQSKSFESGFHIRVPWRPSGLAAPLKTLKIKVAPYFHTPPATLFEDPPCSKFSFYSE
jgi:hypothetical protein